MKSKQLPLLLALTFLVTTSAYAGRDEALIQITRKNQLAHDAKVKKEKQEKEAAAKEAAAAKANGTGSGQPNDVAGATPSAPAKS
jgi:hypothetical protein